jgi:hypothetical protein
MANCVFNQGAGESSIRNYFLVSSCLKEVIKMKKVVKVVDDGLAWLAILNL